MRHLKASMMLMGAALLAGVNATAAATVSDADLAAKVAHEIRMYPQYGIWDNVNLEVRDGHVALTGEVNQPYKKADLGRIAERVEGVAGVSNELKVLPLSTFDDRLRWQVARAIYGNPVLSRYGLQAIPPIHIIVENGKVTLEGVVSSEMDKNVAGLSATGAGLSFGPVVNNLRVENPKARG
ncbi:MAG: BON domain-containing protein [Bryobacteraceae bacterium]